MIFWQTWSGRQRSPFNSDLISRKVLGTCAAFARIRALFDPVQEEFKAKERSLSVLLWKWSVTRIYSSCEQMGTYNYLRGLSSLIAQVYLLSGRCDFSNERTVALLRFWIVERFWIIPFKLHSERELLFLYLHISNFVKWLQFYTLLRNSDFITTLMFSIFTDSECMHFSQLYSLRNIMLETL